MVAQVGSDRLMTFSPNNGEFIRLAAVRDKEVFRFMEDDGCAGKQMPLTAQIRKGKVECCRFISTSLEHNLPASHTRVNNPLT